MSIEKGEKIIKKKLYDKEYRKRNKDKLNAIKKKWALENPDKIIKTREKRKENKKITDKKYTSDNKEKINVYRKKWALENPEKIKAANAKYHKNKLKNDPLYRLKHTIGNIIRNSIKKKGYYKNQRSVEILGCDIETFRIHIESKFENWMSWDNYGGSDGIYELNKKWDIDHIIPLSSASSEEEIIKLNHYTNLQPLCSYYNRFIKKDKL